MAAPSQRTEVLQGLKARLKSLEAPSLPTSPDQALRIATTLPALDALLEGGFSRGSVTALNGKSGAGTTSLIKPAIHAALLSGERVGIVDGTQSLYAPDWFTPQGEAWIIRSDVRKDALWAAEAMASSGAFALVALLPPTRSRGINRSWAARLRQAAREGESALVVLDDTPPALLNAAWGLRVTPLGLDISTGRWRVRVQRIRGGPPTSEELHFDVQARLYTRRLPPHSLVPDRRAPPSRTSRKRDTCRFGSRPRHTGTGDPR